VASNKIKQLAGDAKRIGKLRQHKVNRSPLARFASCRHGRAVPARKRMGEARSSTVQGESSWLRKTSTFKC